eukprot:4270437-Pleurochrysis_carterae.AAC.4
MKQFVCCTRKRQLRSVAQRTPLCRRAPLALCCARSYAFAPPQTHITLSLAHAFALHAMYCALHAHTAPFLELQCTAPPLPSAQPLRNTSRSPPSYTRPSLARAADALHSRDISRAARAHYTSCLVPPQPNAHCLFAPRSPCVTHRAYPSKSQARLRSCTCALLCRIHTMFCVLHARARGTLFAAARNAALLSARRAPFRLLCMVLAPGVSLALVLLRCGVACAVLLCCYALRLYIQCCDGDRCVFARPFSLRYMSTRVRP